MPKFPKPFFRKPRQRWYVEIDGKQHNLGADREEAFRLYHELMGSQKPTKPTLTTLTNTSGESTSVLELIDTFLDWTLKHKAKRTYEWYVEKTTSFARSIPRELTVPTLKPFHVQEWVDSHDDWASGQKRGCITAIQRVFNWGVKQGRIEKNPIRGMEKPTEGRRERVISPEEFLCILERVRSIPFKELLIVSWETGCRPQEIIRVTASHVDLTNNRWVFPAEEAKGKKRVRCVYLTPTALEITRRLIVKHPDGPIFRNDDGVPWRPQAIACAFTRLRIVFGREELKRQGYEPDPAEVRRLADELRHRKRDRYKGRAMTDAELMGTARRRITNRAAAKLSAKICLYNLRHSWATRALENGIDAVTVSVLMGHADTRMLSRVYQHLSQNPAHLLGAAQKATL